MDEDIRQEAEASYRRDSWEDIKENRIWITMAVGGIAIGIALISQDRAFGAFAIGVNAFSLGLQLAHAMAAPVIKSGQEALNAAHNLIKEIEKEIDYGTREKTTGRSDSN